LNNMVSGGPHYGVNNSNVNFTPNMGSYPNRSRSGQHIPLHHLHSYQQHQHTLHDKQQIQAQEHHSKNHGEHLRSQEYRQQMQTNYNNMQHHRVSSSSPHSNPNTGGNLHF